MKVYKQTKRTATGPRSQLLAAEHGSGGSRGWFVAARCEPGRLAVHTRFAGGQT